MLLSGRNRDVTWFAAVLTFIAFSIVSLYFGIAGVANCGCLGVVKTSPYVMLAIDVSIVVSLLVTFRPDSKTVFQFVRSKSPQFFIVFALFCAFLIGSRMFTSDYTGLLQKLRGYDLNYNAIHDIGGITEGEVIETNVILTNLTDSKLTVISGTSDCSCIATASLPVEIDGYQRGHVVLLFKAPAINSNDGDGMYFQKKVQLITTSTRQPVIEFLITGRYQPRGNRS